jgi:hypothetical protein
MSRFSRRLSAALVPATLLGGAVVMQASNVSQAFAGPGSADPTRCELRVVERGSMTTLEGLVFTTTSMRGNYRMTVVSSGGGGGSDIEQSGSFNATSRQPESLGQVSLGGSGGTYTAKLTVKWDGGSTSCTKRVGGRL